MKLTLHSTSAIVRLNGIECRIWEGTTGNGVPVTAFIPRVAVSDTHDPSEFERELRETRQPEPTTLWPARMVL